MRRQFIDSDLITWEVHSSTGDYSLPEAARLVFLCTTDRERRPRSVPFDGDVTDSGAAVETLSDEDLRRLLAASRPIS